MQKSNLFADGINIERVYKTQTECENHFKLYAEICERGSGETLSCGSGAVAICYAFAKRQKILPTSAVFEVVTKGGSLWVSFKENFADLYGETVEVFRGEIDLD